jgi:hypothetical protein
MFRASNQIRTSYEQDGAVVLDVLRGQIFGVNPVGSKILQLLESGRDEPSIVSEISHDFGIGEDIVRKDLKEFVGVLIKRGFLEPASVDG